MKTVQETLTDSQELRAGAVAKRRQTKSTPCHVAETPKGKKVTVFTFDRPDSSANIFDAQTLDELEKHIDEISSDKDCEGLVFISAKPSIFIAGADLNSLEDTHGEVLNKLVGRGQQIFEGIASLEIPTIAAIHGVCLGGGLELALACDGRIASPDRATKIGLPETMLGILPAWGGSTRLPRLIGLPTALNLILSGKQLAAKHALKLGVIDGLAPQERLLERALVLLDSDPPKRKSRFLTNNPLSSALIRCISKRKVLKKTRGNYPAQEEAIDVVTRSGSGNREESFRREREAIMRLVESDVTGNLMRIFHLQENAKKFRYSADDSEVEQIGRTAVIGAGVMGAGIAQWFSARNVPVILKDIGDEQVAAGMKSVSKTYRSAVKKRIFSKHEAGRKMDLIFPTAVQVPMENCDLVVEAAVENLEVKKKIFADLCSRTRPDTILATNTSALPISDLGTAPGVTHPGRILGLHFFNPVARMKLVEIVVTEATDPAVVERILQFVRRIGKLPVVVKDSPGFLVNRILMPYLIEAGRMVEQGIAPRRIDEAMLDFGMPMGPIRLLDEIGLDVALHVADTMIAAFGERFAVPDLLKNKVESGNIGKKSGSGFYRYDGKKETSESAADMMSRNEISTRLAGLMVDEAKLVLDEGVASSADDIDFAMILGTGFAPFRGGPMTYGKTKTER